MKHTQVDFSRRAMQLLYFVKLLNNQSGEYDHSSYNELSQETLALFKTKMKNLDTIKDNGGIVALFFIESIIISKWSRD